MSSISNPGNFLRVQRNFPQDLQALTVEINKAYVDIANQVNSRISGIYGTTPIITGESWFPNGETNKKQSVRQIYPLTASGNIAHGINWASVKFISPRSYGTYTDGTNWYGISYNTGTPATNQVTFYVTPTNIVITRDAGAPAISSGTIDLEWISN